MGIDKRNVESRPLASKAGQKRAPTSVEKESLASLMDFGAVDPNSPALPLVMSLQTYTLRLIVRARRSRLVDEAWGYLKLDNPGSPANLIWHVAKASKGDPKTIRQLESLAQTILSMCPSISNSDDDVACDDNIHPSPDVVFSLQHLALKIRQRWWVLAKHQGNEEKELLEPFSKCLVAFARRSKGAAVKSYNLAEVLYTDLLSMNDDPNSSQRKGHQYVALAARSLSNLAQAAGLTDEALRWLAMTGSTTTSPESALRKAIRLVRTASLSMDAALKGTPSSSLDDTSRNALEALAGDLKGSSSELESLFVEVNALRRVVSRGLAANTSAKMDNGPSSQFAVQALRIVKATVHFCARFLGTSTPHGTNETNQSRHKERALIAIKHIKSIVDSVCVCSKLPVHTEPGDHWSELDALVQDCSSILQYFEDGPHSVKFPDDLQCPFIKVSNAYWTIHLHLKIAKGIVPSTVAAMQRSVTLLQKRPLAERQSGLILMKLERLGEALETIGATRDARESFHQCITECVDSGLLQDAALLAAAQPIYDVFDGKATPATLGRVLRSYHRSFLKNGLNSPDDLAVFDSLDLPPAERGILLEWQLTLYLKTLSRNRSWNPALNPSIHSLSENLLHIYQPSTFPIRRRRVCVMLLQLSQEHPSVLPLDIIPNDLESDFDTVEAEVEVEDRGLLRYNAHLKALLKLQYTILASSPRITDLQKCFEIWEELVESATTWKGLVNKVDDPEHWLHTIETTTDYLFAKGEEYFCMTATQFLVKIYKLQKDGTPSRLVTSLCKFGTQALRLGYSGKAGLAFAEAETWISTTNIPTETKLQWYIAYAEYLLTIGNLVKW